MKGFIELTNLEEETRVFLPVSGIKAVVEQYDGRALVEFESMDFGNKPKDKFCLFLTAESYEEVKTKIQNEV